MAAATQLHLPTRLPTSLLFKQPVTPPEVTVPASLNQYEGTRIPQPHPEAEMDEAIYLVGLCRAALNALHASMPSFEHNRPYTADEILGLPLMAARIDDGLHGLPRRKSTRGALAVAIAGLLYPCHDGSLSSVIRYEADRVKLRAWVALQRKHQIIAATRRHGRSRHGLTGGAAAGVQSPVWASRILAQGPWDQKKTPISLKGARALPMPVTVAEAADLAPFFGHLEQGGTHQINEGAAGVELENGKGEPRYGTKGAEFRKGVVYEDGRMDLCKMVVGPDHIANLMDSLRPNEFVKHFLLGNNIIGPVGAQAISRFITDLPNRMETWYLAGNCIDSPSFKTLVDAMVQSEAITNIWLKRNPLGRDAAGDVYRLITETKNLRTLDLDQTELGDAGFAELFQRLASYKERKLPLQNLYLNGSGISEGASQALAAFLASPSCGLTSVYMSLNPLGDAGALALARGVSQAPQLIRLSIQSTAITTVGASAILDALKSHPSIHVLDMGQAFATEDLGQAYNYLEDGVVPSLIGLISASKTVQYLNLGHVPVSPPTLRTVLHAVAQSPPSSSLLFFSANSVLPDPEASQPVFNPSSTDRSQSAAGSFGDLQASRPAVDAQLRLVAAVSERLAANVRARYGEDMSYQKFLEGENRWVFSDKEDVRKIDSVYRTRDVGMARRGLMKLVKEWEEGDETLERVMEATGPYCCTRKR